TTTQAERRTQEVTHGLRPHTRRALQRTTRLRLRAALRRRRWPPHALHRRRTARRPGRPYAPRRTVLVLPLPQDDPHHHRRRTARRRARSHRLRPQRQAEEPGRLLLSGARRL